MTYAVPYFLAFLAASSGYPYYPRARTTRAPRGQRRLPHALRLPHRGRGAGSLLPHRGHMARARLLHHRQPQPAQVAPCPM